MENAVRWQYKLDLNERILKFVEEHETKVNKVILPLAPKVLVFILPKEHRYSANIILPDKSQNKPVYEGVVVRTFKPYTRTLRRQIIDFPDPVWVEEEIKSSVEVGDHVLFSHWVGAPVPFMDYDMHKFRLVDHTEFLGVLEYSKKLQEQVAEIIMSMPFDKAEDYARNMSRKLQEQFVIVTRDEWSRTTSGVGEYSGQ